jgi:hypothetical protein
MSQNDISGISYKVDTQGSRSVSNPYSIPVNVTTQRPTGSGLEFCLETMKQTLEANNRRIKHDMEQSHWYKETNGCRNAKELRLALKGFNCNLTTSQCRTVANAFPNEYGGIDFKMLTHRLFCCEGDRRKYTNLRQASLRPSQFPGVATNTQSANASIRSARSPTKKLEAQAV